MTESQARECVTLSLMPGSLDELLAGQYATRVWLERDEDGHYRMAVLDAGSDPTLEAIMRLLGGSVEGQPPEQDPSPEVVEMMDSWRPWIEPVMP